MVRNYEQQLKLLSGLSLGFGIAALVLLALAVFLFIWLKIPQVFSEYRGKNARKAMEEMAANSAESGSLISSSGKVKKKKDGSRKRTYSESLTDDISQKVPPITDTVSSDIQNPSSSAMPMDDSFDEGSEATDALSNQYIENTMAADTAEMLETELLENMPLEENLTTVMQQPIEEEPSTEVLSESKVHQLTRPADEGTMVLDAAMLKKDGNVFVIEKSIVLIHTEKVI